MDAAGAEVDPEEIYELDFEEARPAGTLLRRLLAAIASVGPARWAAVSSQRPAPVAERAVSWAFLVEWHACLEAELDRLAARGCCARRPLSVEGLDSYMIVGDKDLAGSWQGAYGRDPSVCHAWCVRALAAASTRTSLVEALMRAAELTGDERLVSDASGAPYFGRASARPRSSRTSASGMKLSPAFPPSSLPTLSGARPRSSRTSGPRR